MITKIHFFYLKVLVEWLKWRVRGSEEGETEQQQIIPVYTNSF